jgi:hypothetical protein
MIFDIGCMSPLLWSFEERDKILTFFDFTCGCRMHVAYFCLCGVFDDLSFGLLDFVLFFVCTCLFLLDLYDLLCVNNRISYLRLRGISLLCIWDLCFNSISGVLSRSCGLCYDVRLFICFLFCLLVFVIYLDVLFHDTFYVIGHFHVMFASCAMIGIFAAFYFYFPAIYGVKYSRIYAYTHTRYTTTNK